MADIHFGIMKLKGITIIFTTIMFFAISTLIAKLGP